MYIYIYLCIIYIYIYINFICIEHSLYGNKTFNYGKYIKYIKEYNINYESGCFRFLFLF